MSEAVAELATRARIADPMPTRCCACYSSPTAGMKFIDYDAIVDRGVIVQEGSMAVLERIERLALCEACVKSGAQVLGFKPDVHSRQFQIIRRQEKQLDHYRAELKASDAGQTRLLAYIAELEQALAIERPRRGD